MNALSTTWHYGLWMTLLGYGWLVYLRWKPPCQARFLLYLLALLPVFMVVDGRLFEWLPLDPDGRWGRIVTTGVLALGFCAFLSFERRFLSTASEAVKLDRILLGAAGVSILSIAVSSLAPSVAGPIQGLVAVVAVSGLIQESNRSMRSSLPARYALWSLAALLVGMLLYALAGAGFDGSWLLQGAILFVGAHLILAAVGLTGVPRPELEEREDAQAETDHASRESPVEQRHFTVKAERQLQQRSAELDQLRIQHEEVSERLRRQEDLGRTVSRQLDTIRKTHSQFISNIGHEFRTPLMLIRGPIDEMRKARFGPLTEKASGGLQMASENVQRLEQLIGQMLDIAHLEAGQLLLQAEPSDLVSFVHSMVTRLVESGVQRGVEIEFGSSAPTMEVYFDRDKMERAVKNLLENAIRFSPDGGHVSVRLTESADQSEERGADACVELRVTDNGEGISTESMQRFFERVYPGDRSSARLRGGAGLGLAVTRGLVELHGGDISVSSVVGEGTCFTLLLPKGRDHLADDEIMVFLDREGVLNGDDPASGSLDCTILVVEDNAQMRSFLKEYLEEEFTVLEASDGAEGLRIAREMMPDLVVTDVRMPNIDGLEMLRMMKQDAKLSTIPVVMLTARAAVEDRIAAFRDHADAYLSKPFNMDELRLQVRNLIQSRSTMRARYSREVVSVPSPQLDLEDADKTFLERAMATVEERLADDSFNVDALAEALFVSTRTLHRRLLDLTGKTPAVYIRDIRLACAKQMLDQHAVRSVGEAALKVGFRSTGYFSRLYRQTFGDGPPAPPSKD